MIANNSEPLVTLTYNEAKAELLRLADANPDFIYKDPFRETDDLCVYFDPDSRAPSCIVGHVLAAHGVTLDGLNIFALEAQERGDVNVPLTNESSVSALVGAGVIGTKGDDRVRALLQSAQFSQDEGTPWGAAVAGAVNYVERSN